MESNRSAIRRIKRLFIVVGPGIFCVGYSIGTGSIVSMSTAGSMYGLSLLWLLVLACIFSFVMMEAYGRYTLVTGETALFAYKHRFSAGRLIAMITFIALVVAEVMALIGIVGVISDLLSEWVRLIFKLENG